MNMPLSTGIIGKKNGKKITHRGEKEKDDETLP
jgi:hypothetical protein